MTVTQLKTAPRPTDRWLAAASLKPLEGPADIAERLLLLVHYGIDWQNGWISGYRDRYWDHLLPDRIWCATFQAPTLRRWWREVAKDLVSAPRNQAERAELEVLLRHDAAPVLQVMRDEAEALLLRTRIVTDAVREERLAHQATARQEIPA